MRTLKPVTLLLGIAALLLLLPAPLARTAPAPSPAGDAPPAGLYDVRIHGRPALESLAGAYRRAQLMAMAEAASARRAERAEALERLRSEQPDVEILRDPLLGSTEVVRDRKEALTPPSRGRTATETGLAFLKSHAAAYGLTSRQVDQLERRGESLSPASGIRMVRLRQKVRGLPVFQSDIRIVLDREGRLIRTVGRLVPGVDESRVPFPEGSLSAAEALRAALRSVGVDLDLTGTAVRPGSRDGWTADVVSPDSRLVRPVPSRLTYFPIAPGVVVPAWEQVSRLSDLQGWYTVVDARTGTLLYRASTRRDLSKNPARFSVYVHPDGTPLESPAPGSSNHLAAGSGAQFPSVPRTIVSMHEIQDPIASPNGWIPDNGHSTVGNNADVFLDPEGFLTPPQGVLDDRGRPRGNPDAQGNDRDFLGTVPRSFEYDPAPLASDPHAGDNPTLVPFQRGSVTQLFYLLNWWHDRTYRLGFDEAARNYQKNNLHRGGKAGDPIVAGAQAAYLLGIREGGGLFFTAPDESRARCPC